jgi:hypothetical protein
VQFLISNYFFFNPLLLKVNYLCLSFDDFPGPCDKEAFELEVLSNNHHEQHCKAKSDLGVMVPKGADMTPETSSVPHLKFHTFILTKVQAILGGNMQRPFPGRSHGDCTL